IVRDVEQRHLRLGGKTDGRRQRDAERQQETIEFHLRHPSEGELQTGEDAALGRSISAVGCAAVEQNGFVFGGDVYSAVQIPVHAADDVIRVPCGDGRVGEDLEDVVVDLKPAVA